MREIKFRAWDKEWKMMLEIFDNVTQKSWFLPNWKDRYEVMQYTGLKDKNGVEIYEKYICRYSYINSFTNEEKTYIWVVEHDNGMYWLRHINGLKKFDGTLFIKHGKCEVIGNIYEHPHLLEDKA